VKRSKSLRLRWYCFLNSPQCVLAPPFAVERLLMATKSGEIEHVDFLELLAAPSSGASST